MNTILEQLKNKKLLWQANHTSQMLSVKSTGFIELDSQLHGGFPQQGVIDIDSDIGIGELRLLLPDFQARQEQGDKLLVFIAPPLLLNSETLAEQGFVLERVLIIKADTSAQALWSAEQCLNSGCCYAVVLWQHDIEVNQVKRLQLATEKGDALLVMLRYQKFVKLALPVSLAMQLRADPQGIEVEITKRKGGWPSHAFSVNMRERWPELQHAPMPNNILHFPTRHYQSA